jgi:hypothetical protein
MVDKLFQICFFKLYIKYMYMYIEVEQKFQFLLKTKSRNLEMFVYY